MESTGSAFVASDASISSSASISAIFFASASCRFIVLYSSPTSIVFTWISSISGLTIFISASSSASAFTESADSIFSLSAGISASSDFSSACTSSCGYKFSASISASTSFVGISAVITPAASTDLISIGIEGCCSSCTASSGSGAANRALYFSCCSGVRGACSIFSSSAFMTYLPSPNHKISSSHSSTHLVASPIL